MEPGDSPETRRPESGRRRQFLVAASFLAWAVCFVVAMRVLRSGAVTGLPLSWLLAAVPSLLAAWIIVGYTRYLRSIDELQRLIQLQAMGWGFGGGFFVICGYLLFVPLGAPADYLPDLLAIMPALFALGLFVGCWRYR